MTGTRSRTAAVAALALLIGVGAEATIPPKSGVEFPAAYTEQLEADAAAFSYERSYLPLVKKIQQNRIMVAQGLMTAAAASAQGGVVVTGSRSIPVLTATFQNSGADPFPVADLQTQLFDGPWPTGTMTEYYEEISYGNFTVGGTVFPWFQLSQDDAFYEGGCNGLCAAANVGQFITETLTGNDGAIDFSQFDNDGADGVPNSGDDDGFVDFVAFVHPESGGECGNTNLWSHRWALSNWIGNTFETDDAAAGGGFIQVDDYVIQPAFACDDTTMIEIGVFAHEFGHAFGLPDLYDTDDSNGDSNGIGNWGLMGSGSWGGDGNTPSRPSHMSAWSKEFLGWINPAVVNNDVEQEPIDNVNTSPLALKLVISDSEYFLVENRQQIGFDDSLTAAGLLIWHINDTVIDANMNLNRVNADENNKGVDLEEADGDNDLDNQVNRGDPGDIYTGSSGNTTFDIGSNPQTSGTNAVCDVDSSSDPVLATVFISSDDCAAAPEPPEPPKDEPTKCSALGAMPPDEGGGGTLFYLAVALLPVAIGILLAAQQRRRKWSYGGSGAATGHS